MTPESRRPPLCCFCGLRIATWCGTWKVCSGCGFSIHSGGEHRFAKAVAHPACLVIRHWPKKVREAVIADLKKEGDPLAKPEVLLRIRRAPPRGYRKWWWVD